MGVTKMNFDEFLYNLHFDIDKVRPVDLKVDFKDAPLPYKLYRGLPIFPLSVNPLSSDEDFAKTEGQVTTETLATLFWYTFGLTNMCQSFSPFGISQSLRRYVPSGGALYPNELYAYLKIDCLPHGVYHYDVAHHSLVLLREGNYDTYLEQSLGNRCDMRTSFGTIFISAMFWKNFFKYNNFSYRLQGIDTGIVAGQLLEVAKRIGYDATVYYQFLDQAVNHLIGLQHEEESIYAIVPLSIPADMNMPLRTRKIGEGDVITSDALCQELVPMQHERYEKSQKVTPYPLISRINEMSMLHSTAFFSTLSRNVNREPEIISKEKMHGAGVVNLPAVGRKHDDFVSACSNRYSPGLDFILGKMDLQQFSTLLHETVRSYTYHNDMDTDLFEHDSKQLLESKSEQLARLSLCVCLHNMDGITDGAYVYDPEYHSLCLLQSGDHRFTLQQGLSMQNVNMFQTPICLHIVGDTSHLKESFGYRGYRIQQMEVGMLLQRLLLSASSLGMNGHALLGYDETLCDSVYGLTETGKTCLVQVPIGYYRTWSRLQGGL
jgi:SagB-type dehydrogenase family enzyme